MTTVTKMQRAPKKSPKIPVVPGALHVTVRQAIKALADEAETLQLFQRAGRLVRPSVVKSFGFKNPDGERPEIRSLRLTQLSATTIRESVSSVATFTKERTSRGEEKKVYEAVIDCPKDISQTIFESPDRWEGIPVIESISEAPLYDGKSLFCGPGTRDGVYVVAPKIVLPPRPTKDDAVAALARVAIWIDEFSFTDPRLDRAALLAFFLTAALRFSIDNAPMFVITKHEYGSGATTATKMGAILATGREPGHAL